MAVRYQEGEPYSGSVVRLGCKGPGAIEIVEHVASTCDEQVRNDERISFTVAIIRHKLRGGYEPLRAKKIASTTLQQEIRGIEPWIDRSGPDFNAEFPLLVEIQIEIHELRVAAETEGKLSVRHVQ